ncbi:MAG: glycosyl hydrolase, partial [Maribacter sp.]|nr:glycosyl hydrolase [Maribacter sp.]
AVREDPVKEGLLFLATEHGVYFSMNDGELWQSLQLKLPDTPVRDLVIKDNDVVLGTHGRGFWILDDIQPIRQFTPEMTKQDAVLFKPTDALRGLTNASIQYYLKEQKDTITFEIYDAKDQLINTFTGSKPKYEVDPNLPYWLKGGSSKPTTAKGINNFTWDMRYTGATTFDGMIIWSARPARGPKAPLGIYKVKMKSGDYEKIYDFEIKMDPNLKGITKEDLDEQFELSNKIMSKTSAANEAVIKIREIKKSLTTAKESIDVDDYTNIVTPFLNDLSEVEEALYQVKNQSGQDPLNFPIKLNNRLASLRRSVEDGDAKPTNGAYKVFEELSAELKVELEKLDTITEKYKSKINPILTINGASEIE